ncbi:MAG: hypothetical protein HZB29_06640 [Nitrospinae bacterium]|nr:hypothetical protein [Nitrospinota bacterium]
MDCGQVKELIWESVDGSVTEPVTAHLAGCPSCREELSVARQVKQRFAAPVPFDANIVKGKVMDKIRNERIAGRKKGFAWPVVWPVMAAAALLIAVVMISPAPAPALNFDDLLGEHTKCVKGGHHKGFTCATQMALMEKTMSGMGMELKPVEPMPGKFVAGEVCEIRGIKAAHAVIQTEGKIVSRFSVKDPDGRITRQLGTVQMVPGLWKRRAGDEDIAVIQTGNGYYDVVIGQLPFETLVKYGAGKS